MRNELALFTLLLAAPGLIRGEVRLPALISSHMVLQRGLPVRVWGWADAGEDVTVSFLGQKVSGRADTSGRWELFLNPMESGGPAEMTVAGRNTITLADVLVGEVWVASGQSNMERMISQISNSEQEIAQANFPQIRLFLVAREVAEQPSDDVSGQWMICAPGSVRTFSAVAYFFGREIHQTQHVPVGLIDSTWGGTPAQSWTSRPALEAEPSLKFIYEAWQQTLERYPAAKAEYDRRLADWKKAAAAAARAAAGGTAAPPRPRPPAGPGHQNTPSGLYNGMIAPLTPYAIRGVLWYQGESNATATEAFPYRRLFRTMIEDWRRAWGIGRFPFYFVQLANYEATGFWPVLRESQAEALGLRNTGMAVTIDIGNPHDIHPLNKQDVGHRLALWARAGTYGEKLVHSGPLFRQVTVEGGQLRLWFDHIGGGLVARGGDKLTGFTIAGKDGKFVPADAAIEGASVVVSSKDVPEPVAARYAWADNPEGNLANREGLPASPFRTERAGL